MNILLIALLILKPAQSSFVLPPRTAIENPVAVSSIPQKLHKDYDKLWSRFVGGKEDIKLNKDLDKLLQKQKAFDAALMIQGYIALYKRDDSAAGDKFNQVLKINPKNRIAVYYLAELAFAHGKFANAADLYGQLLSLGATYSEIEVKRQRAFLLSIDNLLQAATRAEAENRLAEAEDYYRQVLKIAPDEPSVRSQLARVLAKANKKDELAAIQPEKRTLAAPRNVTAEVKPATNLEDLGRWGGDIEQFYAIRNAETVTREQLAVLIVRYFPQLTEMPQKSQILTDIQRSPARLEIQTVAGLGLMDARPNRHFDPETLIIRGEFARTLARLSRLIGVSGEREAPVTAPDVAQSNAMYPDIQLVLGSGLMNLEDSGSFDLSGHVSGRQAVVAAERLVHTFQQAQR